MIVDVQGKTVCDPEKAATTTATGHKVCGVDLFSRYSKQHEYDTMIEVVRSLPPALAGRLKLMWCDSKATSAYSVDGELSENDLYAIGEAFVTIAGGHNGIDGPGKIFVNPDWGVT